MATKVELSTRTTRSDILTETKPSRTYISPLSDASNKSSDTNISNSLIIEDTLRNRPKTVSMLNTGLKPRLSPKPFSREKPPESRRSIGMPFTLSGDVKQHSDVPFQATTSISLSGSTKSNESERVGRRIFTSSPQTSTDEDQDNNLEGSSPTAAIGRRQTSPRWSPGSNNICESKPTPQTDERQVTSKPPLISRKPEISQQEKIYPIYSRRTLSDVVDEPGTSVDKSLEKDKPENIDSLTVRARLRQVRRPVSAVFLELNEPVSDQKVVDEPRKWNRRPLSEDLTSLFESRIIGNKKESASEETKENRPFKKNSQSSSITDDLSNLSAKEGEYTSDKNFISDTRGISGISLKNTYSPRLERAKTKEMPSNKEQQISDVAENEGIMKLSANFNNQSSNLLLDQYDGSLGEAKKSDESGITPGIMKKRLGLYVANTNSSEEAEVPSTTEDRSAANAERKSRNFISDKDTKSEKEWTTPSSTVTTDLTKKFLNSSSKLDMKSEKPSEERRSSFSSQDYIAHKEKKDWQNSSLLEEKAFRPRKSFRRNDEPIKLDKSSDVPKGRRDYSYKELYDTKTVSSDEKDNSTQVEKTVKTVKATMFEHNVEKHSPPEVYHSGNVVSSEVSRVFAISERLRTKHESSSWSQWLSEDIVQSMSHVQKDPGIKDSKFSEKSLDSVSSSDFGNLQIMAPQNLRKVDENRRVEPRYEVVQAIGERVQSESIEMAPEDKAVTLRSRRSFHNKDRELSKDSIERSGSSLQRSKSEYRKKNPLNSPQEYSQGKFFTRDTDFQFERKNSFKTDKIDSVSPQLESLYRREQVFTRKSSSDETEKEKSQELDNKKETLENTLGKYSSDYSHFGTSTAGKGEWKSSFRGFSQKTDKTISSLDSIQKDSEKGSKIVKEVPTIPSSSVRDETNYLTQVKEYKKQPSLNQFHLPKGLSTKNTNKEESNDFTDIMLNSEIEQIKRDLFTRRSSKDADKKDFKEEFKGDDILLKRKDSFQRGQKIGDGTHGIYDSYKSEHGDIRNKTDEFRFSYERKDSVEIAPAKDPTPVDKKATYFAVTGIDSKKQRNDEENQVSSNNRLTSDELYFKRSVKMGITSYNSTTDSFIKEEKIAEKDIDTSYSTRGIKTYRTMQAQDNLMEKPEKAPEKHSVIDIDALLKKRREKSSADDEAPSYLDTQTKPTQKSHLTEPENTQESITKGSPPKLDGTYKTKVVDIDSLMADYKSNQRKEKENVTRDDDYNLPKWERSRSFRDSASKGSSSKWKDPSRHLTHDEGYKYEPVASRYNLPQETTSTKVDHKPNISRSSTGLENLNTVADRSYDRDPYKGREVHSILESSVRTRNYTTQSTTTEATSTSHIQGKQILIKMTGDEKENQVVEREHQSSTRRGSIPDEKTQPLSEAKKPGKASDLISLMLENKDRRTDRHRSRISAQMDLPQEPRTHRAVTQQEWTHCESKEFYKTEEIKQRPTRIREMEIGTDISQRKSLYRSKEYKMSSNEDHVKQCFSRSSTSNKDTDSLVQETDRQYGTWAQDKQQPGESFVKESSSYDNISSRKQQSHSRLSSLSHTETDQHDSITEAREGSLDRSSMDLDSTDGTASTPSFHEAKASDFSFMDQTSVLDSTALKNRVQLSRKSQRRAPSQAQRRSRLLLSSSQLAVIEDTDSPWMFTDSTEDKPEKKDEVDAEEEKPHRSSLPSQRMPMFPGMDHSTLMAQLRKRQEAESSSESSTQPSSPQTSAQPSRSPKSPLPQGTLGVKLLPTSADIQDRGASASPQWLKELKTKKRLSQYENHS
ncbi:uncharacterized protein KIAA1671 homolog [Leptodactylus fuscus]|uniref:uncharacterized protein KIAA1671 homolog n=1 Tax=Leptodactylus fuscus TaxID=238119 RepID=UPI003F4EFA1B